MFGYVFPQKSELKIREFAEYRAVYCSLCEALRSFGFGAKLFLNYDFVFAAMLFMSLNGENAEYQKTRCNTNPLNEVDCIEQCGALEYSAAALIVTSRYKLRDDLADENIFKKALSAVLILFTSGAYNKARKRVPDFDSLVCAKTEELRELELSRSPSVDRASDSTAASLAFLFENGVSSESDKPAARRFGYLLGRFVYLADACDDLESDIRKNRYNPFAVRFSLGKKSGGDEVEKAKNEIKAQLKLSQSEAEASYRSLPVEEFRPILDNIVYLGLLKTAENPSRIKRRKKNGKSV